MFKRTLSDVVTEITFLVTDFSSLVTILLCQPRFFSVQLRKQSLRVRYNSEHPVLYAHPVIRAERNVRNFLAEDPIGTRSIIIQQIYKVATFESRLKKLHSCDEQKVIERRGKSKKLTGSKGKTSKKSQDV